MTAEAWGTKPAQVAGILKSLEDVVQFAYEHGYHEHGVPLVQIVREYIATLAAPRSSESGTTPANDTSQVSTDTGHIVSVVQSVYQQQRGER
jgi:hypothetical protein